jgi:hypothetical protein
MNPMEGGEKRFYVPLLVLLSRARSFSMKWIRQPGLNLQYNCGSLHLAQAAHTSIRCFMHV